MSVNTSLKKSQQLGMNHGTAAHQLRKMILFSLLVETGKNVCFQCGKVIESVDQLSIEHKIPWMDNNPALFWDLENVAFSHLSCNIGAARPRPYHHGTESGYVDHGCRCVLCVKNQQARKKRYNETARKTSLTV